jgi:hypothetical protein
MGWSCLSTAASRPSEIAPDRGRAEARRRIYAKFATQRTGEPGAVEGRKININTDWKNIMSYAIVGFGKIGQAHAFARKKST